MFDIDRVNKQKVFFVRVLLGCIYIMLPINEQYMFIFNLFHKQIESDRN